MLILYYSAGVLGAGFIILAYFLMQINRLDSTNPKYPLMNAIGALLIIISLFIEWNLGAFVVGVFWLGISIFGLLKYFVARKNQAAT